MRREGIVHRIGIGCFTKIQGYVTHETGQQSLRPSNNNGTEHTIVEKSHNTRNKFQHSIFQNSPFSPPVLNRWQGIQFKWYPVIISEVELCHESPTTSQNFFVVTAPITNYPSTGFGYHYLITLRRYLFDVKRLLRQKTSWSPRSTPPSGNDNRKAGPEECREYPARVVQDELNQWI